MLGHVFAAQCLDVLAHVIKDVHLQDFELEDGDGIVDDGDHVNEALVTEIRYLVLSSHVGVVRDDRHLLLSSQVRDVLDERCAEVFAMLTRSEVLDQHSRDFRRDGVVPGHDQGHDRDGYKGLQCL